MVKFSLFILCILFAFNSSAQTRTEQNKAARALLDGVEKARSTDPFTGKIESSDILTQEELDDTLAFIQQQNTEVREFANRYSGAAKREVQRFLHNKLATHKNAGQRIAAPKVASFAGSNSTSLSAIMSSAVAANRKLTGKQMIAKLDAQYKGTSLEVFNEITPKTYIFLAELLRHPRALPQLAKVAESPDKWTVFMIVMLVTFIIGWFIGFFKKDITETWQVIAVGMTQFSIMNGLRVLAFYLIFQEELVHTKNLFFEIF